MSSFVVPSVEEVEAVLGSPRDRWAHQCHGMSLALVRSGLLPRSARVARGTATKVGSQHSWAVLGDPYDPEALVVDITLWSYDSTAPFVYAAKGKVRPHTPHGAGSIWSYGQPPEPVGEVIELQADLSPTARDFLALAASTGLDKRGWAVLAHAPVGGWPAKEILTAMYADDRLCSLIPIDIVGMATDINPSELYF
jgi:hypothetical protein